MPPDWSTARNILAVRLDALGDVLMTTPALRALRGEQGERRVTILTSPAGAAVAEMLPDVDDAIVYEAPWMKATAVRSDAAYDQQMNALLKERDFDGAVIFTVFSQNPLPAALLCYLAEIPLRLAHCRENPYQLLTDWVAEGEPQTQIRHEVRRQLDLVAAVGFQPADEQLRLVPPVEAGQRVANLLNEIGLAHSRDWLVVHPGASAPSRRYPPEHYAAAAQTLAGDHGLRLLFTGSASETALVESIRAQISADTISLAGELSLAELAALIAAAPLVLTNNTGPAHIAAAVGTPVVDLYALTNPQHTPWQVPQRTLFHDVPCKNCFKSLCPQQHHDCLRLVAPAQVVNAVLSLLSESNSSWQPEARARDADTAGAVSGTCSPAVSESLACASGCHIPAHPATNEGTSPCIPLASTPSITTLPLAS
jgi:lipopolysaccharide heptosyltransferase II